MYIRRPGPLRPLSRAKIVVLLAAGVCLGLAAGLAFAGIGPFPRHSADELAGVACGILFMLAVWVRVQGTDRG
ncbi:MAG: hypothetical protein ICV87_14085 [Gemmatimonadetes bacterium]|nr:hypothetical protein [Gemmatimonadota bacterium]